MGTAACGLRWKTPPRGVLAVETNGQGGHYPLSPYHLHVDEHHDMMSEMPPVNFGSFMYFAMREWPECRVHWVMPDPIDYPDMWLSDEVWDAVS